MDRKKVTRYTFAIFAFGLSGAGTGWFAPVTKAAEFDYGIGYISEYSSNILAVPQNQQHDWMHAIVGGIAFSENTDTLVARLTSQVEYRNYARDIAADQTVYAIDGSAVWTILPRRLTWTFEDAARQVVLNPTQPDTPANRAGANALRTGPDIFFNFSQRHALSLGARYMNFYVEERDVDSQAYLGSARWLYDYDATNIWSLNFERQRVDFDNPVLNENFWRNDAYLQLDKRFAQSQLVLLGGTSRIDRDRSGELNGSLARMVWTRNITADSNFGFSAAVGYQDTRFELLTTVSAPTAPLTPVAPPAIGADAISGDVFYNRYLDAFYTIRSGRAEYRVRANARELDFQTTAEDREEAGGRFDFRYVYSTTSTIGMFANYLKVKQLATTRTDRDVEYGIRYGYRMTRNVTLGLGARRHERSSTDPSAEYIDNRYQLSVVYSTGALHLPTTQP